MNSYAPSELLRASSKRSEVGNGETPPWPDQASRPTPYACKLLLSCFSQPARGTTHESNERRKLFPPPGCDASFALQQLCRDGVTVVSGSRCHASLVRMKFPSGDPLLLSLLLSHQDSFVALCPVIFPGYFVRARRRSAPTGWLKARDTVVGSLGNQARSPLRTPVEKCLRVYEWQGFSVPG